MKKRTYVLVPLSVLQERPNGIVTHFARNTYAAKLLKNGLYPIFAPSIFDKPYLDSLYEMTSGLFLMGGDDINPKLYGAKKHAKTSPVHPLRDQVEKYLLEKAFRDKKPVLGICRGAQLMAVVSGGSLYQHVPDIIGSDHHGMPEGKVYDDIFSSRRHMIQLLPGSRIASIVKAHSVPVSSAHHQSVKSVGKNFFVSAVSGDGIVEAVESCDPKFFCIGVQSHPEVFAKSPLDTLFVAFAKECQKPKKYSKQRR